MCRYAVTAPAREPDAAEHLSVGKFDHRILESALGLHLAAMLGGLPCSDGSLASLKQGVQLVTLDTGQLCAGNGAALVGGNPYGNLV